MKLMNMFLTTALIGGIAAPAFAETEAMTTTALTLRSGPSEFNPSMLVLDASSAVIIEGCLEGLTWCRVMADDNQGWVSGHYLTVGEDAQPVTELKADGSANVNIVMLTTADVPDNNISEVAAGTTLGALTAFALGGPVGIIVASGIAGAVAGDIAAEVTEEDIVYVASNPVDTIYLNGEVVIGSAIPAGLETYEVPNSTYRYLVVNNTAVLVDPKTLAIVGIIQ